MPSLAFLSTSASVPLAIRHYHHHCNTRCQRRSYQLKPVIVAHHPVARTKAPVDELSLSNTSSSNTAPAPVSSNQVDIYDTTLRDGTQGEGISLSVADKLKVAKALDEFGVAYIEGGWPGANPKDDRFFAHCARNGKFEKAKLVAFGMTRGKKSDAANDPNVQALLDADTPVVTIVGKASAWHVRNILGTTIEENWAMIFDTVQHLKLAGREVMLDAEHWFDGYASEPDEAMACLEAAVNAGVDVLVLCDTNGGSLPGFVTSATADVVKRFPGVRVGIHTHNDCDLAVANALAAVSGGATLVQGTANGYGERTGNCNLMSVLPTLQLKMGRKCVDSLTGLTGLSRFVEEVANLKHVAERPFVGKSSFAHKGGLHAAAMAKDPDSYQHIDPAEVGNESRVLVSELSGRRNIVSKARELGLGDADMELDDRAKQLLGRVKELELRGYSFEGAEASVELMIRRTLKGYRAPFVLLDYNIMTGSKRRGDGSEGETLATVKLALQGPGEGTYSCPTKTLMQCAESAGPVDAFHCALGKILHEVYVPLRSVVLADYKVRILDNESSTAATTRVMVDFKDTATGRRWTTVSAHENIITASVNALMDGFEFAMLHILPSCCV